MNTNKCMIIINGEIKTSEIRDCKYNQQTKKWEVEFKNSGKIYSYNYNNVERLFDPEVLNPNIYKISRDGKELSGIRAIYVFKSSTGSYWHLCFDKGEERDYKQEELQIRTSCLNGKQEQDVFEFIKQISKLSQLKNENTGEKLLQKNLTRYLL